MDKEKKNIFNYLTRNEGFYMDQCENYSTKRDVWIALKNFTEGIFAVIITDNENADSDEKSAREYLQGKGLKFALNVLVLCEGVYLGEYSSSYPKVIVDVKSPRIVYLDAGLEGLANIFVEVIKRNQKSRRDIPRNWITMALITINIVMYIISGLLSGNFFDIDASALVLLGGQYGPLIRLGEWWRLFTCMFLHGGLIHIASNMYFLYSIGTQVEEIFGKVKYIVIYILSGISASLLSYYLTPNTLSIGASGALFGVLGALLSYAIKERNRIDKGVIGNIIFMILFNFYIGTNVASNIDNFGHLGGLIGGIVISSVLLIKGRK